MGRVAQGDRQNSEDGDERIEPRELEGVHHRIARLGDDDRRTAGVGSNCFRLPRESGHDFAVVAVALGERLDAILAGRRNPVAC